MISFFIPTYGRDKSLTNTINSVLTYWPDDEIQEIIDSDNNTDDRATKIIAQFSSDRIKYSKNHQNIGIDRNMLKFLELCESKYCWLLGDDDELSDESYKLISEFLKREVDFIVLLNNDDVLHAGVHILNGIEDVNKIFLNLYDKIPFGNVIVNVTLARKLLGENSGIYNKYIETSHAYSSVLWELLCSKYSTKAIGIVTGNAVIETGIQKSWTDSAIRIYLKEIPAWYQLLPYEINEAKTIAYRNYINDISKFDFLFAFSKIVHKVAHNKQLVSRYINSFPFIYRCKLQIVIFFYPLLSALNNMRKRLRY